MLRHLWESCVKVVGKLWVSCEKFVRKLWESCEKVLKKLWQGFEKVLRKLWENGRQVVRNFWENFENFFRKCFCPLAEVDEKVQEDQEEGPPELDELDAAASHQDGDQRHPHILPSPPEEPLPQTVDDLPVDMVEEVTPPPVEVVETTLKRPAPVSRGGQDKASLHISGTVPAQGMRRTHTDRN